MIPHKSILARWRVEFARVAFGLIVMVMGGLGTCAGRGAMVGGVTPEHLLTPVLWKGMTNEVKLEGSWSEEGARLWLGAPLRSGAEWVPCRPGQPLRFEVVLSEEAELGLCVGRILGSGTNASSALLHFLVDDLAARNRQSAASMKPLQKGLDSAAMVGRFVENEMTTLDVVVPGGRRWTAELVSRRMGAPGDPVLWLEDLEGRVLASSHAIPGMSVDARVDVEWAESKSCRLKFHESRFRGGATFPYYLRTGRISRSGAETRAVVGDRWKLGEWKDRWLRGDGEEGSVMVRQRICDLPEVKEREPNDNRDAAEELTGSRAVLGELAAERDQDWFKIVLKKGEKISIRALARSLHASCDPWVGVVDGKGQRLVSTTLADREEPALIYGAAEEGMVWIQVREAAGRWGAGCVYRLEVEQAPGFRLHASTDVTVVDWTREMRNPEGDAGNGGGMAWVAELKVKLDRAGWDKPVRFEWEDPVAEVRLENETWEGGKSEGALKFRWVGREGVKDSGRGGMRRVRIVAVGVGEGGGRAQVWSGYRTGSGVGVHLYPIPAAWEEFIWFSSPMQRVSGQADEGKR